MPSPALILWADSSRNAFASGWQSNLDASEIILRQGDSIGVELHWVRRTSSLAAVMEEVNWPVSANITMAVGRLDKEPTSGSFTITYDGDTTSALNYNATATQLQTALNDLDSIASDGGVTVTKTATSYRVLWNTAGVPSGTLAVGSNDLTPTSSIGIGVARTGAVGVRHLVQLHIKQAPVAVCTSWANQDATSVTITQVHAPAYSGDFRIWRMVLAPSPKSGSFRISKTINGVTTWTAPISYTPTGEQISAALSDEDNGIFVSCSQVTMTEFEILQPQVTGDVSDNITALAADGSGLFSYQAKYGVLNLNTLDLELMLNGAASAQATLEIEVEVDGTRETLVQKSVTVTNDLIDTDSYTLTTWGEVIPADSVVRYDTSQALTTPQKTQARTNIAALGATDLTAYATKDTELETRLGIVETTLTNNVKAAISGATSPSSTNVFSTATDLAGKANTSHTHTIANVTSLQTTLDGKASTTHTHTIANVTGLEDALDDLDDNKADTVHSHLQSDVSGLTSDLSDITTDITTLQGTAPTTNEKAAMTSAGSPTASNPFMVKSDLASQANGSGFTTNTFDTVYYPYEITVTIGGVQYAIPARIV